jgi:hypothetical protein
MMENLAMVVISFTSPAIRDALGLDLFWCKRYYGAYTLRIGSSSFTWDTGYVYYLVSKKGLLLS